MTELSLSRNRQWCAVEQGSIVPIGSEYNDIHQRPDCIYT